MPDVVAIDLATGERIERDFTPEERAEKEARSRAFLRREQEARDKEAQRTADVQRVKNRARTDPDYAAMARLMGVDTEGA